MVDLEIGYDFSSFTLTTVEESLKKTTFCETLSISSSLVVRPIESGITVYRSLNF